MRNVSTAGSDMKTRFRVFFIFAGVILGLAPIPTHAADGQPLRIAYTSIAISYGPLWRCFLSQIDLGLADGKKHGIFHTMITTIDHAGRLVIPKDIRRDSGIKPGMRLDVRWENGTIAITPAPLPVKLERKGRLLVAVPAKDTPRLSTDTVERTRKRLRRERSAAST